MNAMECPADTVLQMFVEAMLPRPEQTAVNEHVVSCPGCRTDVAHYKQIMWDVQLLGTGEWDTAETEKLDESLDLLSERLMKEWRSKMHPEPSPLRAHRRLLPAWAGPSVSWTRNLPGFRRLSVGLRPARREAPRPLWRVVAGRIIRRRR